MMDYHKGIVFLITREWGVLIKAVKKGIVLTQF